MMQLALSMSAPAPSSAEVAFSVWAGANDHIVAVFCCRALELRRSGREHYGAKRIVEELRYDTALREARGDWKINNSNVSRLARLAMDRHAELRGFFETRRLAEPESK